MASNRKIKAEVHVNDQDLNGSQNVVQLELTNAQATDVLSALVSGDVVYINLKATGTKADSERFDYAE